MEIHYIKGDATNPIGDGQKVIIHICNDIGKWGRGFVLALSKRWATPEKIYKDSFKKTVTPKLGDVQFVAADEMIIVANLIGQHGVRSPRNKSAPAPIRYDAIEQGLTAIANLALTSNCSLHMPRIGCGLAGGSWDEIEPIIERSLVEKGLHVSVYDF